MSEVLEAAISGRRIRLIKLLTAARFNVPPEMLDTEDRHRRVMRPRQVAMYLCRQLTDHTLSNIGRLFGGRDHTTVRNAVETIEREIAADPEFAALVGDLAKVVTESLDARLAPDSVAAIEAITRKVTETVRARLWELAETPGDLLARAVVPLLFDPEETPANARARLVSLPRKGLPKASPAASRHVPRPLAARASRPKGGGGWRLAYMARRVSARRSEALAKGGRPSGAGGPDRVGK